MDHLDNKMKHLFVSAPIVAVALSVWLLFTGATWWLVLGVFFFTAPIMIGIQALICSFLVSCNPGNRAGPKS